MATMSLFGQSSDGRREPKSLVEFRAGKMKLEGKTVTADTRKGLVYLKMEDTLLHFYWKDRQTGKVEDDLIIFPGDAEIRRISQCTTGRVLLLKFKDSGNRKFFYWLQEPKEDKDDEYIKKVNEYINNPPDPSSVPGEGFPGGGLFGGPGGLDQQQQLLELINQGVLGPLEGGGIGRILAEAGGRLGSGGARRRPSGPSHTGTPAAILNSTPTPPSRQQASQQALQPSQASTPAPPQPAPAQSQQVQLGDLRSILSNIPLPQSEPRVSLQDVVTPDVLRPMAQSPQVQDLLSPHLPPTSQPVAAVLTSPQFQQALGLFSSALESGELGPLLNQFGLGPTVTHAAAAGDVAGFARALEEELVESTTTSTSEEKDEGKKKKDDAKEEQ